MDENKGCDDGGENQKKTKCEGYNWRDMARFYAKAAIGVMILYKRKRNEWVANSFAT